MDLVTQAILGAVIGQAGYFRKLGRRSIWWGAIIALVPDIDVLVKLSSNPFAEIIYHRGITHSLWFGPVFGPLLGYLLWRHYKRNDALSAWMGLGVWALVTHSLLDLFTVYGTQLLAPFSDHRFALSAVPVIDPIYTGILLISLIVGFVFHRRIWTTIIAAAVALTLSSGYLFYGLAQNEVAYRFARNQLATEGFPNADVRVYTTMFQVFLRRVVVHFPNEVWVGFMTTWAPTPILWYKQLQVPLHIRQLILNHPNGKMYQWFTNDEVIIQPHLGDPFRWNVFDSRFGFWNKTILGIWGRTVTVDANGVVYDDFTPFRLPLDMKFSDVVSVWRMAFGKPSQPLSF